MAKEYDPEYELSTQEIADYLGYKTTQGVRDLINVNEIPHRRVGQMYLVKFKHIKPYETIDLGRGRKPNLND